MDVVRRSLLVSLSERYVLIGIQLCSVVVLSRLLTPADIGLFSVAAALIGLAQVVRDFGVGSYLIQERELTNDRVRTAFTVTGLIGVAFFATAWLGADTIAGFYDDTRLADAISVLAFNFLLIPFGSVTLSLLRRDLRFTALLAINVGSSVAGLATSVSLAVLGWGYLSLVWSAIVHTAATCLLSAMIHPRGFLQIPTLKEWRRVAHFGSRATTANAITEAAMSVNDLVVGRVLGFPAVAVLSRAQGVMNLFHRDIMTAVRNVAFPAFARAHRNGMPLEPLFRQSVVSITAIAWPFYGFLALYPLETIRLLFGPQWDEAAHLVPLFCLAGALAATWNLILPLLTATGRIDLTARAELLIQPLRVAILVVAVLVFGSLAAFAAAFLLVYALCIPALFGIKQQVIATDAKRLLQGLGRSLLLTAFALAIPSLLKLLTAAGAVPGIGAAAVGVAGMAAVLSWIAGVRLIRHPLASDPLVSHAAHRVGLKAW